MDQRNMNEIKKDHLIKKIEVERKTHRFYSRCGGLGPSSRPVDSSRVHDSTPLGSNPPGFYGPVWLGG
jgi:hypothetical protein